MSIHWHALTREFIFSYPQWKIGTGLIIAILVVLLALRERGWKILTSLRVTVWTLLLSVILVFFGSLAQVNEGLWDAQERWFKEWFVFVQVQGTWPGGSTWQLPFEVIYPGGHLLGAVLLINLLAAHFKRFTWHFHKVGIQLTHLGIIMLLLGQFLTDELAVESNLSFREGETMQYSVKTRKSELVLLKDISATEERVVSIPEDLVETKAAAKGEVRHLDLPFAIKVLEYQVNGDLLDRSAVLETFGRLNGALALVDGRYGSEDLVKLAGEAAGQPDGRTAVWRDSLRAVGEKDNEIVPATERVVKDPARTEKLRAELKQRFRTQMMAANARQSDTGRYVVEMLQAGKTLTEETLPHATPTGLGSEFIAVPREKQRDNDARNLPYTIVELSVDNKPIGQWLLWSSFIRPQEFEYAGTKWRIAMRFERIYLPFSMKLEKATHDVYQGTDVPKDFRSRVLINNPTTRENHAVEIYMNQPLRKAGRTFYQSQMDRDQRNENIKVSGLQVVENPSWLTPYAGCLIVGLGLLWQFLWHLSKFFSKRAGFPPPEMASPHPILAPAAIVFVLPDFWLLYFGWAQGNSMLMAAASCTLVIRVVIGWEMARGRYLGFAFVFLTATTTLLMPFAIKYSHELYQVLWPLIVAQGIAIAAILTAVSQRPSSTSITT